MGKEIAIFAVVAGALALGGGFLLGKGIGGNDDVQDARDTLKETRIENRIERILDRQTRIENRIVYQDYKDAVEDDLIPDDQNTFFNKDGDVIDANTNKVLISSDNILTLKSGNVVTGEKTGEQAVLIDGRGRVSTTKAEVAQTIKDEKADASARAKQSRQAERDLKQTQSSAIMKTTLSTNYAIEGNKAIIKSFIAKPIATFKTIFGKN